MSLLFAHGGNNSCPLGFYNCGVPPNLACQFHKERGQTSFLSSSICLVGWPITPDGLGQWVQRELKGKKGGQHTECHISKFLFFYPSFSFVVCG